MLDYEKLDVYRRAIETWRSSFARCRPFLEWRRAAMYVQLNIAEAVGKTSEADRSNRYSIARGEAMECGAILEVVRLLGCVDGAELDTAKRLIVRIVEMLSRM